MAGLRSPRAKEVWPLKRPRSGAGVRLGGYWKYNTPQFTVGYWAAIIYSGYAIN